MNFHFLDDSASLSGLLVENDRLKPDPLQKPGYRFARPLVMSVDHKNLTVEDLRLANRLRGRDSGNFCKPVLKRGYRLFK